MAEPEPSGALAGLQVLDPADGAPFRAAVAAGQRMGWGYFFPHLLAQNRPGKSAILLAHDRGSICVFRWQLRDEIARVDVYLPPMPLDAAVLRRCLERANDFNGDRSARVLRIDASDAEALSGARDLRVRPRREQYLFDPRRYESLAGSEQYTIRRNVAQVERLSGVWVAPFTAAHAAECRALLDRWRQAHRDAHGTAGGVGVSRRAIELAETLPDGDLQGEVVLVDGRIAAFAFGGEIRPGLACSFDRKCDTAVRGLSYFHFRSFLCSLRRFDLVNDGSDAGRTGLRQLKDSFRPVAMHTEYRATQRGLREGR